MWCSVRPRTPPGLDQLTTSCGKLRTQFPQSLESSFVSRPDLYEPAKYATSLLGLLLTMSPGWYRSYPSTEDQSLGGLLMWAVGGAVDMLAVVVLMGRYLGAQDRRAIDPDHDGARTART